MNIVLKKITGPIRAYGYLAPIQNADDLLRAHRRYMLKQQQATQPAVGRHQAYVNEGRLLIDCICLSGVIVDVQAEMGCCFLCGRIYTEQNLIFPSPTDLLVLDELFLSRQPEECNFDPRQGHTIAMLIEEKLQGLRNRR